MKRRESPLENCFERSIASLIETMGGMSLRNFIVVREALDAGIEVVGILDNTVDKLLAKGVMVARMIARLEEIRQIDREILRRVHAPREQEL